MWMDPKTLIGSQGPGVTVNPRLGRLGIWHINNCKTHKLFSDIARHRPLTV